MAMFDSLRGCFSRQSTAGLNLNEPPVAAPIQPPSAPVRTRVEESFGDELDFSPAELADRLAQRHRSRRAPAPTRPAGPVPVAATAAPQMRTPVRVPPPEPIPMRMPVAQPSPANLAPTRAFEPQQQVQPTQAHIVEAAALGGGVTGIAGQFGLTPGEVEFALKVARLAKKL